MKLLNKIRLLFTNPKEFLNRLSRYLQWIFLDKLFFSIGIFIFTFFPRYIYLLLGTRIIKKKDRWNKGNPEENWIFSEEPKEVFEEINIICRGNSLEKYAGKIDKNLTTFFVNYGIDSYNRFPELKKIPYFGITADNAIQNKILKSGLSPIICLIEGMRRNKIIKWDTNNENSKENFKLSEKISKQLNLIKSKKIVHFKETSEDIRFSLGSAVLAIFFLGRHSKKVNIYGWDHYLDDEVNKLGYIQSLYNMATKAPSGPWGKRFKYVFAESIWNWHYAYQLSKNKKYRIFSYLANIESQKNILVRMNRIFFNE